MLTMLVLVRAMKKMAYKRTDPHGPTNVKGLNSHVNLS
jgi:hypothetical protein